MHTDTDKYLSDCKCGLAKSIMAIACCQCLDAPHLQPKVSKVVDLYISVFLGS